MGRGSLWSEKRKEDKRKVQPCGKSGLGCTSMGATLTEEIEVHEMFSQEEELFMGGNVHGEGGDA